MFVSNPRLLHILYSLPIIEGAREVFKVADVISGKIAMQPEAVAGVAYAGCALATFGLVLAIGTEISVVSDEMYRRAVRLNGKQTVEDRLRAERATKEIPPAPFEGLNLITRVDGVAKPAMNYNYVATAVKINKARHIAVVNCQWHRAGKPADLTETTWARNRVSKNGRKIKKFCSRRELNEIKAAWEADGALFRTSAAKNAQHDVQDWQRMDEYARGKGPLPC